MSIENSIRRNVAQNETERGDLGYRLIHHSEGQQAVTEKWVIPNSELIIADAEDLRAKVDRMLQKDAHTRKRMRLWDLQYPHGLCKEITTQVSELMQGELLNTDRAGMKCLRNFVREGGVIKPFWGIDDGKYFQNAIQIGTSVLDVANDTIDPSKEPVVFHPTLQECPIKSIQSVEQFADVAEKYWDRDIYPNIYLPWLAPVFPAISIVPPERDLEGETILRLETGTIDLLPLNFSTSHDEHLFGLSEKFLTQSPYSEKRLPPKMLEQLLKGSPFLKRMQTKRPDIFKVTTDPEAAMDRIREFHWSKSGKDEDDNALLFERYHQEAIEITKIGNLLEDRILASLPKK